MKQFIIVTFVTTLILLINANSFFAQEQENDITERTQNEFAENQDSNSNAIDNNVDIIFQCQVDLEVLSSIPGKCSKCGLTLKEFTLDEVIANLNEDGHIRPELKLKMITMVEAEEDSLTVEIIDTVALNDSIPGVNFSEFDHFGYGTMFQCPNCPDQVWSEEKKCMICGSFFELINIEEAEANMRRTYHTKKPDEEGTGVTSSQ